MNLNNKLNLINFSLILLLLLTILYYFKNMYIGADASFYIPLSRDVSNGYIIYKDIPSGYTPIMMYINSLLFLINPNASFLQVNILHFFIIFLNSLVFYKILIKRKQTPKIALLLSIFLFTTIIACEGRFINLEIYVTLFLFLAFLAYEYQNFFWCGIFISLGTLSKQYGILNYIPFLILAYFSKNYIKNLLMFSLSSVLTALLFIFYFVIIENYEFSKFLSHLIGTGVNYASTDRPGFFVELMSYLKSSKIILILITLFIISYRKKIIEFYLEQNKYFLILIIGFFLSILPTLVTHWAHYFILLIPYLFLLINEKIDYSKKINSLSVIAISILFLVYTNIRTKIDYPIAQKQKEISEKYIKIHPKGTKLFLNGDLRYLYILNNYENVVLKSIGYDFLYKPDQKFREKYIVLENK